jgi:hypothetical protein
MELVVKHGLMENVLNAQLDGISMPLEFANQSATNVELGLPLENVKAAIQVTLFLAHNVSKILIHLYQLPMIFVQSGKIKHVLNALIEHSSIQTEFVNKFQLNALHGML